MSWNYRVIREPLERSHDAASGEWLTIREV